jgi:UDP-N-acetylmuramoyl-L-alanyl-D-glutamate--2,6-diaminopimelate ligase
MKLNELVAGFAKVDSQILIAGITLNSRAVKSGDVFIAAENATLNYILQAIELGVCAVIYDQDYLNLQDVIAQNPAIEWIRVANLNDSLADIAARYYQYPSRLLEIIGITGTNGKTSCSQFLAQILTDSVVIGTLGWGTWGKVQMTGYTTPNALVLQEILAKTVALGKKTVVMEVSSHGVQEKRIENTLFKGAIFTNLSRDHLDYHGSMENYFQAKLALFQRPELEFVVVNQDDVYGKQIIEAVAPSVKLWTFGINLPGFKNLEGFDKRCVIAKNVECSINGIQFEVFCNGESATIHSSLFGEFNVENMLAVLTTLLALGFDLSTATAKISALQSVVGRMEYFGGNDKPAIFVDFAHTPDALEKVLQSLRHHNPKSLSVVFGCGGNRDTGKRALMGAIAEKLADKIIITDDNPRFEEGDAIVSDILMGCKDKNIAVIRDRAFAIQTAISQAKSGDCIVIAGKGHEDYQEIKGVKTPFSDQEIVKKALALWTE